MLNAIKKILILAPVAFVIGCGTVPYNSKKPIEMKGNFATRTFTQDGKPVSPFEVLDGLKQSTASAESAKKAATWTYVAYGLAFAGGFLVGYNLTKGSDGSSGLLGGIALIGGGAGAAYLADAPLQEAVREHNSGNKKHSSLLNFDIHVAAVPVSSPDQFNAVPLMGLNYQF